MYMQCVQDNGCRHLHLLLIDMMRQMLRGEDTN